jgi:hypothetical protein
LVLRVTPFGISCLLGLRFGALQVVVQLVSLPFWSLLNSWGPVFAAPVHHPINSQREEDACRIDAKQFSASVCGCGYFSNVSCAS